MKSGRLSVCLATVVALGLSACSSNYSVDASFPRPLVDEIPINVGLELSEQFRGYTFYEDVEDRDKLSLEIGRAQSELFQVVVGQMFQGMEIEAPYPGANMIIHPEVDTFQYAIPRETRANIYEVWIKYRVQITDQNGQNLADWLINGYGKTPTAFLKSEGEALQAAVTLALRDIGVQFSIGFARQQLIQDWLQDNSGAAI